jgi:hypothetical protein
MKPLQHARITVHRYGGGWQDWIAIHDWIDRSKAVFPSMPGWMFDRVTCAAMPSADHPAVGIKHLRPLRDLLKSGIGTRRRRRGN